MADPAIEDGGMADRIRRAELGFLNISTSAEEDKLIGLMPAISARDPRWRFDNSSFRRNRRANKRADSTAPSLGTSTSGAQQRSASNEGVLVAASTSA